MALKRALTTSGARRVHSALRWAADKFGARKVFSAAIIVFTLGSILCGLSTTLLSVVLSRVVQGAGGAMMVPVGRLVILRTAPKSELVNAMAWLTIPALIGPLIGPPVGGFIATYFHWRYIFWINAPIGLLGVVLATFFIPDLTEEEVWRLYVQGALLSGFGLSVTVLSVSLMGGEVESFPLSAVLSLLAAGLIALALYWRHARRTPTPILDLGLLSVPTFRAALPGGLLFRIGVGAISFLLPLLLQLGFDMTAFQSGSLTFVAAAGAIVMKTTAKPILRAFGFRRVLIVNALLCSLFLVVNIFLEASTPHWIIISALLLGGFFGSLEFTALNAIGFADIEQRDMSRATSFSAVGQQLSQSFGVAVGAAGLEFTRPRMAAGSCGRRISPWPSWGSRPSPRRACSSSPRSLKMPATSSQAAKWRSDEGMRDEGAPSSCSRRDRRTQFSRYRSCAKSRPTGPARSEPSPRRRIAPDRE